MSRIPFLIALIFVALNANAYRPISDERMQELLREFDYTPDVQVLKSVKPTCSLQDVSYTTTYPQLDGKLTIQAKLVVPAVTSAPLIIILPPLGGANTLDVSTAETFCRNKMAALLITSNLTGLDQEELVPVTDHDHTVRRVASAVKAAMIVARTYPQINFEKVGVFGASLGGILGSVAYAVIPEISAGAFVVNGGDVPHILATSDQQPVVSLKKKRKAEVGLDTDEQYEEYLNNNMTMDPLHFAKLIRPEATKLFLSKNDASVPTIDQMLFYNAIGTPAETRFYSTGHAATIVSVLGLSDGKQKIAEWFLKRFAVPNPRMNPIELDFSIYR
jgi:cephalosporin-C deacetylase-like acetyl esterase